MIIKEVVLIILLISKSAQGISPTEVTFLKANSYLQVFYGKSVTFFVAACLQSLRGQVLPEI